ncbi:MAG TPA: hypothetical protein VG367_16455 [Mucilaginibacter sp.]|jgi:hypothetical protein|nr:hypothetical protein [Mucilaginibacter sp.]
MSQADLKQLLLIIEQQLDWDDPSGWQGKDFEILNELILEKTKISLSASTLRRIWGRVEYNHMPSGTTLDTLAQFAGFDNWRAFTKRANAAGKTPHIEPKPAINSISRRGIWTATTLAVAALVTITLVGMYVRKANEPANGNFSFKSRPVTRSLPNSVIFDYNVKANPGDSVFIQQSWDPTTRTTVDKTKHQFTSIYYVPGFYHAKLLVNNKIVKEHTLMIPTDGWLGLIENRPVPVYLNNKEYMRDGILQTPISVITAKNFTMEPQQPAVSYYNVGNFAPVPLSNFSFSTEVRNDFNSGSGACQLARIILFTDNVPVIVELSAKGCISNLRLLNGRYFESGKDHDLSGFGTDVSKWVKVECKSAKDKIQYYVDGKLAYESELPKYVESIVGMGFNFQGTGSVRAIDLKKGDSTIFKAW